LSIVFRRETVTAELLDPRQNFALTSHDMEFRYDPLTGRSTRLAHFGAIKPQPLNYADYDGEKKGFCPFCPANLEKVASLFPPSLVPEGLLRRGETALIANIAPYDAYSGLVILSDKHVLPLSELTESLLSDAFWLAGEFLERIRRHDPQIPCYFLGWNYMPPSGGGLVHAHIQVFGSRDPGNVFADSLRAAREYRTRTGHSFWPDFLAEEKKQNQRYLGKTGDVHWLVPFAPLGVLGDVMAVMPGPATPAALQGTLNRDLVSGLTSLFACYRDQGVFSFNASLHFSPVGEEEFPLLLRISPRTFLNNRYCPPDTNFFQVMLQQPICVINPEQLAAEIRPYFTGITD
jgi:UDPglucose--hexose-1-phosphate uridylyltransferase